MAKDKVGGVKINDLLSPTREIDIRIEQALSDLGASFSLNLLLPKENNEAALCKLIKRLLEKDSEGVFVTFNKTANDLQKIFSAEGIDLKKVHFVDAVTLMIDGTKNKEINVEYLESPSELVEVSVAVEEALKKINSKNKFLLIDSLTTLLVYNSDISVEKFSHAIAQKVLDWNVKGIFLMTDSTSKKIVDTIAQFCDKTAKI